MHKVSEPTSEWREATTKGGRHYWPTKMVATATVGLVVRPTLDWREATTEGGRKDWPTKMVDKAAVGLVVRLEKITSNRHQTSQNYLGMARSHKNGRRSEGLAHQNGGQGCSRSGREVGENNIESAPNQNYLGMARSHNRRRSEGLTHQNGGQSCSRSGREFGENNIESTPNQNS
jgi:hypothetical protein